MRVKEKRGLAALGLLLCALALALAVLLAHEGYLTYLTGDMASEVILARRQVDTGSLVQMDWIYSTEIHSVHMNLLYALAFLVTPSYEWARILGDAAGFIVGMASLVWLLRGVKLSWGASLCTAAMLPVAASTLYAANMTVGGYYIVHLPFLFFGAGLWLRAGERGGRSVLPFALLCAAEGLLSVRYVLCFVCPMLALAALDALFAREARGARDRFALSTGIGFLACCAGYAAGEFLTPRLFQSGVGAASSFSFAALDGPAMARQALAMLADFLKLLGWRGEARLFSAAGAVNALVAGTLLLGGILLTRALRGADEGDAVSRARRRLLLYALSAFAVNLLCFVLVEGTYLNRYLLLAALPLVPAVPVALAGEKNVRLRAAFLAALCAGLTLSAALLFADTRAAERGARERDDMAGAIEFLEGEGYTHGYGGFWNARIMQERSQGALTFSGVRAEETEEGALAPKAPAFIRWLEPDAASDLDACPGKTFLALSRAEAEELSEWLALCAPPLLFEQGDLQVYGFDSSAAFATAALLGSATLEPGDGAAPGADGVAVSLAPGGRLRFPPAYREAGRYALRFACAGAPGGDAAVRAYTGRDFALLAEQPVREGENEFCFELPQDDKYFMLQIVAGEESGVALSGVRLERADAP